MVTYETGDIFSAAVDALVDPVNTMGISGAGLALQFKRTFPVTQGRYEAACRSGELRLGHPLFVRRWPTPHLEEVVHPQFIVYFPTKHRWWDPSLLAYIEAGLEGLVEGVRRESISSIAIPALGCGLGQLEWSTVEPLICAAFKALPDVAVHLYPPR